MKPSRFLLSIAILFFLAGDAWNQNVGNAHTTRTTANEEQIRTLLDRWAKAFEARDIDAIMSNYAPGDAVIAYDIAPPLQYRGKEAYRKDYLEFL
ncbi:MAG TPA: nuclear transport factor 2 family protein, partial [Terriglobales bacterium]|nr:nuclear transport factor 2 family protein [Terriglobales bacterium]